jgi:DNA-binding transcriptional LysR family regulator
VRVSAFTSAMRAFVIDAAADVARQHPGISVQLVELEPAENVPALERGEVDLAIVADFGDGSLPSTPHLRSVPLTRDELMAVLPLGTHFTGLADLHDANWLLDGTELEQHVIRRCRRIGFEPRFAGRLFSHEALLYAVQRGLGVTILPSFVTAPPGTVQLRPLVPPAVRELLVLHREEALTRRSVALTLDVLVKAAAAPSANEPVRVTEPS